MTRRQERVASLILQELSHILQRKVKDPRLDGVHIVSVDISPDFHLAHVFYSTLDESKILDDVQKAFNKAKAFIRRELKKVIKLRIIPELVFHFDPSIRSGDRILNLLRKLNAQNQSNF